jgi:hypothetical protein
MKMDRLHPDREISPGKALKSRNARCEDKPPTEIIDLVPSRQTDDHIIHFLRCHFFVVYLTEVRVVSN